MQKLRSMARYVAKRWGSAPGPRPDRPGRALLAIWAFAGLGFGVLWAEWLNRYALGGFPLGFWFAQQGSILVFVALILVYAVVMERLDRRHHAELEALQRAEAPRSGSA